MTDSTLLHELILRSANRTPDSPALNYGKVTLSYTELQKAVTEFASGLMSLSFQRGERIAIYLEKRFETVISSFGTPAAGGVFVPINPLLKTEQVSHILRDCNARVLVTSPERLALLQDTLPDCHDLRHVVVVDAVQLPANIGTLNIHRWADLLEQPAKQGHRLIDTDVLGILYTSGSTGKPKGVVLSHRNMVAGAKSVASYLENRPEDTLLAVPPLYIQLTQLEWPETITEHLRYFANTGGRMPRETLMALRQRLPKSKPFLMYGLTEAFRSTYLPTEEVDRRPDSIGKAIPNAEILVLLEDGTPC